jgi:hypothetical protein
MREKMPISTRIKPQEQVRLKQWRTLQYNVNRTLGSINQLQNPSSAPIEVLFYPYGDVLTNYSFVSDKPEETNLNFNCVINFSDFRCEPAELIELEQHIKQLVTTEVANLGLSCTNCTISYSHFPSAHIMCSAVSQFVTIRSKNPRCRVEYSMSKLLLLCDRKLHQDLLLFSSLFGSCLSHISREKVIDTLLHTMIDKELCSRRLKGIYEALNKQWKIVLEILWYDRCFNPTSGKFSHSLEHFTHEFNQSLSQKNLGKVPDFYELFYIITGQTVDEYITIYTQKRTSQKNSYDWNIQEIAKQNFN